MTPKPLPRVHITSKELNSLRRVIDYVVNTTTPTQRDEMINKLDQMTHQELEDYADDLSSGRDTTR